MNTDAKILNKTWQQYIFQQYKIKTHHEQVGFISGVY